jgi:hypothetical protein
VEVGAEDVTARTSGESVSPPEVEAGASKTIASTFSGSDDVTVACEACNALIPAKLAMKIDSGQLLCSDCLKELRSK